MNRTFTPSRQRLLAEQIAGYGAEQRRLKAAAAARRAAAAVRVTESEAAAHDISARPGRASAAAGRRRHPR